MNHIKKNTTGLDCVIKQIQCDTYDAFTGYWGSIDLFGRVYKNPKKDKGIIPEVFEGHDYREILLDDKKRGHIFFIDGDEHKNIDEGLFQTELKAVFILNLNRVTNASKIERRDELVEKQAYQNLNKYAPNFRIMSLQKTIPLVFQGFDLKRMRFDDMHPYHVFAYKGLLNYKLLNNC